MEVLTALGVRTPQVDAALLDLNADIFLEADNTGVVVAAPQVGELVSADLAVTQRALLDAAGQDRAGLTAGLARALQTGARAGVVSLPLSLHRHPAPLTMSVQTRPRPSLSSPDLPLPLTAAPALPGPVLTEGRRQQRVGVEKSPQGEPRSGPSALGRLQGEILAARAGGGAGRHQAQRERPGIGFVSVLRAPGGLTTTVMFCARHRELLLCSFTALLRVESKLHYYSKVVLNSFAT